MKILIVCLHAPGRVPGQRFRFEQYLEFLRSEGIECTYSNLLEEKDYRNFYGRRRYWQKLGIVIKGFLKRMRELKTIRQYDLVFIQREAFMLGTTYFEKRYARHSKIIFDYDDAIWLDLVSGHNRRFRFLKNPDKTKTIISLSKLVFAGNRFLADYALQYNKNVVIVPTTIDTTAYQPAYTVEKEKICIGWSGSFSTIAHFETCLDSLLAVKKKYGDRIYFKVIGDGNYSNNELGIKGYEWKKDSEIQDLREIDIGIMPLPDDEWSKGKCGLKGLQYMALAIPTIMSPVGVNCEIIQDGHNGFLASATDEWIDKLSRLIESPELRLAMGEKGRHTVLSYYSTEANKNIYLNHFKKVATS
jgi:glycosyltransferase involved in cell wall biosynthesis